MSQRRKIFVFALLTAICGFSLHASVTWQENFPFAPYTMYSQRFDPAQLAEFQLVFVSAIGEETQLRDVHTWPLDRSRIYKQIDNSIVDNGFKWEKLQRTLNRAWEQYIARKDLVARQFSEEFVGLRLYRIIWGDITSMRQGTPKTRELIWKRERALTDTE